MFVAFAVSCAESLRCLHVLTAVARPGLDADAIRDVYVLSIVPAISAVMAAGCEGRGVIDEEGAAADDDAVEPAPPDPFQMDEDTDSSGLSD